MKAMNDVIILKTETGITRDADGFKVPSYSTCTCFGAVNSVRASEVYDAFRNGFKMAYVVAMNLIDYKGSWTTVNGKKKKPNIVVIDDIDYQIVRTYQTNDSMIELSVAEVE